MAVQSSSPAPNSIPISATVQTTMEGFPDPAPVTAWMLVQGALTFHNEYGNYQAKRLVSESGPSGGMTKPASTWLQEITALFDPAQVSEIHGRLFILGLCELDSELARFLDSYSFRDALKKELLERQEPPFETLLRTDAGSVAQQSAAPSPAQETTPGTETPPPTPPIISSADYIVFRADAATAVDQLGRQGFADALATWLNRIWGEDHTTYLQLRAALAPEKKLPEGGSFIVHLHGPWGAGKTSLLKLMESALKNIDLTIDDEPRAWTVVLFNAWRNRHMDPAWWPLMDQIYRGTLAQGFRYLKWFDRKLEILEMKSWENLWRVRIIGLGQYGIAIVVALILMSIGVWVQGRVVGEDGWVSSLVDWIGPLSTIIGFVGSVIAIVLAASRSFSSGSAASAQSFVRLAQDPMEKVRVHFSEMLDRVNGPVMVFIDDLDRCQPEYVVRLLESIQTLFNDSRVFYVIAADRRWLYECFEIVYKDFTKSIREPGRRTGYLFLEKIFQMSISVPAMSEETQKAYLDYLYRGERHEAEQKIAEAAQKADADFAQATTTEALIEQLQTPQPDPDPLVMHARREAAVRRLASQEVSADIEHFLQPFAPLLERNPRAMKRLVNAYSVYLALAMLADVELINNDDKKKRFALWTIFSLRWPSMAEKLEKDPELLPPMLEMKADGLGDDLTALVRDEEVQRVLHGEAKGVGVALDAETIMRLWGLQASTSTTVVA